MPRKESADPGAELPRAARGAPRTGPVDPQAWFWESARWSGRHADPAPGARIEPAAVVAALVGLMGVAAAVTGQRHHSGSVVDLLLFLLALAGTLLAIVLGGTALSRLRQSPARRGRGVAFVALAEGWGTVLLVLLLGAAPLAGLGR